MADVMQRRRRQSELATTQRDYYAQPDEEREEGGRGRDRCLFLRHEEECQDGGHAAGLSFSRKSSLLVFVPVDSRVGPSSRLRFAGGLDENEVGFERCFYLYLCHTRIMVILM